MPPPISFVPAPFGDIEQSVRRRLAALPGLIDSYVEEHILKSTHVRIEIAGADAGFASLHQERLITQFALADFYRAAGTHAFWELRHQANVQSAYVPTCDEYFLAHALDDQRRVNVQAFLFQAHRGRTRAPTAEVTLRSMVDSDPDLVQQHAGDFFDRITERIAARELFVSLRDGQPAGFGILERSSLLEATASIGIFTIVKFRGMGVGSATVALLIEECRRQRLRPVAGCWFYNHASKRALERGGMHAAARLLKIDY